MGVADAMGEGLGEGLGVGFAMGLGEGLGLGRLARRVDFPTETVLLQLEVRTTRKAAEKKREDRLGVLKRVLPVKKRFKCKASDRLS